MNYSKKPINNVAPPDLMINDEDELIHVLQREFGDDAKTWNYTVEENGTLVFSSTSTGKLLTIVGFEKMKNQDSKLCSKENSQSTENLAANVSSYMLQGENECVWETRSSDYLNIMLCPSLKLSVHNTHIDRNEEGNTNRTEELIPDIVSTSVASEVTHTRTLNKKQKTANTRDSNWGEGLIPRTASTEQRAQADRMTDSISPNLGNSNTCDEKKSKINEKAAATNVAPQQWDLSETLFNQKEKFVFKTTKKKGVQNSLQRVKHSKNYKHTSPQCKQKSYQDTNNNQPFVRKDNNEEKKTNKRLKEFTHVEPLNGLSKSICVNHEKEMIKLEDNSFSNMEESLDSIDLSYKMSLKEFTQNWDLEKEKSQHRDSPFSREKMFTPSVKESSQNSVKTSKSSLGDFANSPKQSLSDFTKGWTLSMCHDDIQSKNLGTNSEICSQENENKLLSYSPCTSDTKMNLFLSSSDVESDINPQVNQIKPVEDKIKEEKPPQESQADKSLVDRNKKSTEIEDREYYDIELILNGTEDVDIEDPSVQNGEGIVWDQPFRPHTSIQSPHTSIQSDSSISGKTDPITPDKSLDESQTLSSDSSFTKEERFYKKRRLDLRTILKFKCYPMADPGARIIRNKKVDLPLNNVKSNVDEKGSAAAKESKVISLKRGLSKFSTDDDIKTPHDSQKEWHPPSKLQEITKSETLAIRISNPVKTGTSQRTPQQKITVKIPSKSNQILTNNSTKVSENEVLRDKDTQAVVQKCPESSHTTATVTIQSTRIVGTEKLREDPWVATSLKLQSSERESSDGECDPCDIETNCALDSDIDAWSAASNVSKPIASRDPRKAWRIPKPQREEEEAKEPEPTYSYPLKLNMQQKILSCGPKRWFDKLVKYYIEISSGGCSMVHPLYIQDISKALRLASNDKNLHQSFESFIRTLEQLKGVVQKGSQLPLIDRNNIAWIGVTLLRVAQMSNQWKEGYQILYHMHEKEIPYHVAVVNKNMSQLDIIELAFQFCFNTDQAEAAIQILEGTQWLLQIPKGKKNEIDHRKRRIFLLQKLLWKLLSEIQGDELEGDGLGRQKFLFELSNTVFEKMLVTGPEDMQKLENYSKCIDLKRYYNLVLSAAIKVQEHEAAWMLFKSFLKTAALEPTKVNIRKLLSLLAEHSQYEESLIGRALTVAQSGITMGLYPAQKVGKEKEESEVQLWACLTSAEMHFLIFQLLLAKKNQLNEIACARKLNSLDYRMKVTILSNTLIPASYKEAFNSVELHCNVPTAIGKVRRVLERQITPRLDIHSVNGGTIRLTIQTVQNFTASLDSTLLAYQF